MGRIKHFVRGVASGYAAIAANVIYTIASVPLALHYLPREQFGLWALIMQIAGYLALADLGMSASIARILAEAKDDKDGGRYGSILKTGQLVVTIQGLLVSAIGIGLAFALPRLLQIAPHLRGEFTFFVGAQAVLTGIHFFTRVLGAPFWCHQRYDITNLSWTAGYVLSFIVLWVGFHSGLRLGAMLLANIAEFILTTTVATIASCQLKFWPSRGAWGTVSRPLFRELFGYGKDLFLMTSGVQLVAASQVIIITRTMGLEAAAVWAVCTKTFSLAQQLVGRIFDFSLGAFSEMLVRDERARLEKRYREILVITASTGVFVASVGALCNSGFVALWTGGRISWSPWNDLLMGVLLVVRLVTRCHVDFVALTKNIRSLKYLYLFEGLVFVVLALLFAGTGGFPLLILLAVVLDVTMVGIYSARRVARFFKRNTAKFTGNWISWPIRLLGVMAILGGLLIALTVGCSPQARFFIAAMISSLAGAFFLWTVGLDDGIRMEISSGITKLLSRLRPRVP